MPLENNAKISDVIASLSDMQGINQKAELASVIGAPALASDTVATQINKIQNAKDVFADKIGVPNTTPLQAMANNLVVGKKWASGVGTPTSNILTIAGLAFTPSVVFWYRNGRESAGVSINFGGTNFDFRKSTNTTSTNYYTFTPSALVTYGDGSIQINVGENNSFNWVAIE